MIQGHRSTFPQCNLRRLLGEEGSIKSKREPCVLVSSGSPCHYCSQLRQEALRKLFRLETTYRKRKITIVVGSRLDPPKREMWKGGGDAREAGSTPVWCGNTSKYVSWRSVTWCKAPRLECLAGIHPSSKRLWGVPLWAVAVVAHRKFEPKPCFPRVLHPRTGCIWAPATHGIFPDDMYRRSSDHQETASPLILFIIWVPREGKAKRS